MIFGIDHTGGVPLGSMVSAGVKFTARYVSVVNSDTAYKIYTLAEAQQNASVGIAMVNNFEYTGSECLQGFSAGVEYAALGQAMGIARGMTPSRPTYMSYDGDYTLEQVLPYAQGVYSVLGPLAGGYGSYTLMSGLAAAGVLPWRWQTYAWSNSQWFSGNHIQQYMNDQTIGGVSVDFDEALVADYGQWYPIGYGTPDGVEAGDEDDMGSSFGPYDIPAGMTGSYTIPPTQLGLADPRPAWINVTNDTMGEEYALRIWGTTGNGSYGPLGTGAGGVYAIKSGVRLSITLQPGISGISITREPVTGASAVYAGHLTWCLERGNVVS